MKENDGDHPSSKGPDTGNMNNGQKQALVPGDITHLAQKYMYNIANAISRYKLSSVNSV